MVLESPDSMVYGYIPELRGYEGPWPPPEELRRRRMSFEEFARTPWEGKAEWVDGQAIFMIAPTPPPHGRAMGKVSLLLGVAFPALDVLIDTGIWVGDGRFRRPDLLLVYPNYDSTGSLIGIPLVAIEVVSKSSRTQDYIDKAAEYAQAGIGQYWIVDWQVETITILRNDDGAWRTLAELTREEPVAGVPIADVGSVVVDLNEII